VADEIIETDRLEGTPHPRERQVLFGQQAAEESFLAALGTGRLHHAWLVGGPEGIGKATLAYRAARFLLAPAEQRGEGLSVRPGGTAARQVAALSHPGLAVLRRTPGQDGKAPSAGIPVESVRRALGLFATTAADGGHRVCIVDCAEDLNAQGANALLKMVEEPPAKSLFFIVSHAPQRILPTIRSRCRRLDLRPLPTATIVEALKSLGPEFAATEPGLLQRAAALSDGSVRRAVTLLDADKIALVDAVERDLAALPRHDLRRTLALAERLRRRGAEDDYALALDTVRRWAEARVEAGA
jgi:DNA polymerase III subunit delta'